jgi:hypothetical protein
MSVTIEIVLEVNVASVVRNIADYRGNISLQYNLYTYNGYIIQKIILEIHLPIANPSINYVGDNND